MIKIVSAMVAFVLLMGLPTPSVAQQDEEPTYGSTGEVEEVSLTTSGGSTTQAVSPAGCKGYTRYPHWSYDYASVHGVTKCGYSVSKLWVGTSLTRQRWWGRQQLKFDDSSTTNKSTSYDATPHYYCKGQGYYDYTGWSDHRSYEGGKTYFKSSRSVTKRFGC